MEVGRLSGRPTGARRLSAAQKFLRGRAVTSVWVLVLYLANRSPFIGVAWVERHLLRVELGQ